MQLFSEGPPMVYSLLAQAQIPRPTSPAVDFFVKNPLWAIVALVVSQLFAITSYWIASKFVADYELSRLGQAIKVWLFLFVTSVVTQGGIVVVAAFSGQNHAVVLLVSALLGIISLILLFAIPMQVYAIGFLRAIGFWLLAIISGMVALVAIVAIGFLCFVGLMHGDLKSLAAQFKPDGKLAAAIAAAQATPAPVDPNLLPGEALAADRTKSIAERTAGINQMYAELTARFRALPQNDPVRKAEYEAENTRYLRELEQLKADSRSQEAAKK